MNNVVDKISEINRTGDRLTQLTQWRLPIALRLFLTVLLTTLLITTVSLGVLHWTMQKNFSQYVTQVEMQKLEHLNNNLAEIYQVYGNWDNALKANFKNVDMAADRREDKEHLYRRWLRRQYDIAQQQSDIIKNPALFHSRVLPNGEEYHAPYIPSHFDPFAAPPEYGVTGQATRNKHVNERKNEKKDQIEESRRWLFPLPDRLGFGSRIALYDAQKVLITGESAVDMPLQPIDVDGKIVGYLGLRSALDVDDALSINFFSNQQRYLLLVYAVSILISAIVALILAASFRKPIHRLLKAAQELSHGNYRHYVKIKSNDELGDLSRVINELAIILDQHEQSRRQWVADTSHELKTPISVLQAQIEAMQDGVRKPTPEHLARMMAQVNNLKKLTQDLADLALADAQQLKCYFTQIDPWQIVQHEVENFRHQFEQKQLHVTIQGEGIQLQSDPDRFRQIVANLLSNSVRYTEIGGQIDICTHCTDDVWTLQIDDSPLGLSDQQLAQLGERFYRVDDSRTRSTGGTGLGLALSKKIIQILGGELQFAHSPLGGLRCMVCIHLDHELQQPKQKSEQE